MIKKLNIYNVEQNSEAWFDLRCGRITTSHFQELISAKSTTGYKGLVNRVAGEILTGKKDALGFKSEAMQDGIDREPEAKRAYQDIILQQVVEVGFITNNAIHEEYVGSSPDGLIMNKDFVQDFGLVEIKCPLIHTHIEYLKMDVVPSAYRRQIQGQLLVTGADYCDFISYYPNLRTFVKRVEPDLKMHELMTERLEEAILEIKIICNEYQ